MAATIASAVIGVAGSAMSRRSAKKQQKKQNQSIDQAAERADPYAKYRDGAANRLNELSTNPNSVVDGAVWKARQQAAERIMASQGYTGSGNAVVAAADAGASAYQQEFDNLAMLSGASTGTGNAANVRSSGFGAQQNAADNVISGSAGVGNALSNLGSAIFNRPVTPGTAPAPIPAPAPRGP